MDLKREQLGSRVYEEDESDMQEFKQNPCWMWKEELWETDRLQGAQLGTAVDTIYFAGTEPYTPGNTVKETDPMNPIRGNGQTRKKNLFEMLGTP